MPGWCSPEPETLIKVQAFVPVHLCNYRRIVAPVFQVCAGAKARDYFFYPGLQTFDCIVIKVIPVVMGDQQVINLRNVLRCVHIAPVETPGGKLYRGCAAAEYR